MVDNRFEFVKAEESATEHITSPTYSYWKSVFRKFFSSKLSIFMMLIMLFVCLMAIFHPMISHYDNLNIEFINVREMHFIKPNFKYLFGTDDVGRNVFDMVWAGARNSLLIAAIATLINTVIGVTVGMFWGFSKRVDAVMIEIYNVISNVPFTLIVMILSYSLGAGLWQLIFALSCTMWINTAYSIRVQVMIIRDREYNMASQCLGTPLHKIIFNNILPFLVSIIMTLVSRNVPTIISFEVFLGYLGVGLSQKYASLGRAVQANAQYLNSASYLFFIPLTIAALISVSLYIVGQTLADASDPRTHMM